MSMSVILYNSMAHILFPEGKARINSRHQHASHSHTGSCTVLYLISLVSIDLASSTVEFFRLLHSIYSPLLYRVKILAFQKRKLSYSYEDVASYKCTAALVWQHRTIGWIREAHRRIIFQLCCTRSLWPSLCGPCSEQSDYRQPQG